MADEIIPSTVEEADSLIAENHAPNTPMEMETAPKPQPVVDEHIITVNGQPVKATLEKLKQWASMGHGAPTQIGKLNARIKELEGVETKFKQFSDIDNYATSNPDWWKHVEKGWSERNTQNIQNSDSENSELSLLKNDIASFKSFKDEITNEKAAQKMKSEDDALNAEIKSIETNYPDLDFATPDETGKSLQTKILEHAEQNGISNYRAAFRDYFHDSLLKMATEKGKESSLKDRQQKTKLGIIGQSKVSTKGLQPVSNLKSKSYDDLMKEGLKELEA